MIDLKYLRANPSECKAGILKKDPLFPVATFFELEKKIGEIKKRQEDLLQEKNKISKDVVTSSEKELLFAQSKAIQERIDALEEELTVLQRDFENLFLRCPNLPDATIPIGGKECNEVVKKWGEKKKFSFSPKDHSTFLAKHTDVDFATGASLGGSGFILYHTRAAKLLYRLCQFFIKNNEKYGFQLVLPPYLVTREVMTNASNLPRFSEDIFHIASSNLSLIPTAEVALASLHQNSIIEEKLPLRYTAWTSCFRKEAGGYGANDRGLIRIHQFEKVELFSFVSPEEGEQELAHLLACAENILQLLELHYQVTLLATGDCSFASAKTYDIEIWFAGKDEYREVSSVSWCTDFQSRRSKTRYRDTITGKTRLVHTLNGSSLAIPRVMVALFEKYQNEEGGIDFDAINKLIDLAEKKV